MAHLIDKDALVAEIENLLDKGKYHEEYDCAYRDGNNGALYALKDKLDTLEVKEVQEEPVSEDIEEAAESYAKYERSDGGGGIDVTRLEAFIEGAQWQKKQKPVSEDLADAAKRYALNNTPYEDCTDEMSDAFKAGAQWQKQQDSIPSKDLAELIDTLGKRYPEVSFAKLSRIAVRVAKWKEKEMQSTIELVEDHAILTGMNKMEQQMMAKAIDAQCFGFQGAALFSFRLPADNYLVGSEVKVIVIEED